LDLREKEVSEVDGGKHITRKLIVFNVNKRRKMECAVNVAGMEDVRNPTKI